MTNNPSSPGQPPNTANTSQSARVKRSYGPAPVPAPARPPAPHPRSFAAPGTPAAPPAGLTPPVRQPQAAPPAAGQPAPRRPTIALRNLRFAYPGARFAIDIPALDFYPGELTYLGGVSGSGKSTLMKILALELAPEAGDMWVLSRHLRSLSSHDQDDLRGGGLTYIPQGNLGLIDRNPVENIVRVLQDFDALPQSEAVRRAYAALGAVRLPAVCLRKKVGLLSGGEQARVAIAKVFATERPICLMDEILPALDKQSRLDVLALLQQLAAYGFTVAVIAHQPELQPHFHRVIEMDLGRVVSDQRNATLLPPTAAPPNGSQP